MLAAGRLRAAGETRFGDRRVLRLLGREPSRRDHGAIRAGFDSEYLVDAEIYAPVRITYRLFFMRPGRSAFRTGTIRVTFERYERLPLTPENAALLRIRR
jgi:hypothetical protein